jgi:RNA-directed DNA polymerase
VLARLPACTEREGRAAADRANLRAGYTAVYDADLQAYFDTIPHDKLMKAVERRVTDRSVLSLIRMWLDAPVEDRDEDGRRKVSRPKQGTPQGGVISPLLANLYLHWFDVVFHRGSGPGVWAKARLVRYADDFVIMARYVGPHHGLGGKNRGGMAWPDDQPEEDSGGERDPGERKQPGFRGLHLPLRLGPLWKGVSVSDGRSLGQGGGAPQRADAGAGRAEAVLRADFRAGRADEPELRGWGEYFSYGHPRRAHRKVNAFVIGRLTKHLKRRSQRACRPPAG